ncbi:AfsR/SARP family transcriptional regulator [Virgisporangium aurantiacum]|uniref:AfsR/SARP family transcriptional regulator n=1 Tax=Virgisporangium aurantiacum TaxID=175570 RepID=UPI0019524F7A|nr:hypothetical protein [Virgisporangium aurantiacum]
MRLEFRVLGEVQAHAGGGLVEVGNARQWCVLAALLVDANRPVPLDQLIHRAWGDRVP